MVTGPPLYIHIPKTPSSKLCPPPSISIPQNTNQTCTTCPDLFSNWTDFSDFVEGEENEFELFEDSKPSNATVEVLGPASHTQIPSHDSKISCTPSSSRTPVTVNNIDEVEKETKNGRGHISRESVSKIVNTCISIPEKKWSQLVRRFIPFIVIAYYQFRIVAFIDKVFSLSLF
eukprot:TRINITY_DN6431_c0_g2_i2.p1 TRINITY_DN6431_c0_g2~~TRINITY_DN6431_c0_g2_i2.p1  ORF type:complete len:174 (+),score=15.50 TRINITY_DN6431_c0_g2_i2:276-797(+)